MTYTNEKEYEALAKVIWEANKSEHFTRSALDLLWEEKPDVEKVQYFRAAKKVRQFHSLETHQRKIRALYRAHCAHVGTPLGGGDPAVPTTRGDLLALYERWVANPVDQPDWVRCTLASVK